MIEDGCSVDRYDHPAMPSFLGPLGACGLAFQCKTFTSVWCIAVRSNDEEEYLAWTLGGKK